MNRKMHPAVIASCLLSVLLLAACGQDIPAVTDPASADEVWDRDAVQHWKLDENGSKTDIADHVLDDVTCTICGSDVWVYEDGMADVVNYDDHDNLIRYTGYDADGTVQSDMVYVYTYDANGAMTHEAMYLNGVLSEEITYRVNAEGESVRQQQSFWYEDGTTGVNEFDINDNMVKSVTYDADGKELNVVNSEFAVNEDGYWYETKRTENNGENVLVSEFNSYSDLISWNVYSLTGELETNHCTAYSYDEDGNMLSATFYMDGVLISKAVYRYDEEGWRRMESETMYNEDGSYTVYTYDENEEIISEQTYLAG